MACQNGEIRFDHAHGTIFRSTSSVPVVRISLCETGCFTLISLVLIVLNFRIWLVGRVDFQGSQLPHLKRGTATHFSAHVYCG